MIRILRHTLCLALLLTLAACEKDREPRIEVSTGEIHLPGDASSGTTFTVLTETFLCTVNCRVRGRTFTQSGSAFVPSLACSVTV